VAKNRYEIWIGKTIYSADFYVLYTKIAI